MQILPNMQVSAWLIPLVKGIWNHAENKPASGTAARQWITSGAVHINGEKTSLNEFVDFPVFSIVVFPKASSKRVTLL